MSEERIPPRVLRHLLAAAIMGGSRRQRDPYEHRPGKEWVARLERAESVEGTVNLLPGQALLPLLRRIESSTRPKVIEPGPDGVFQISETSGSGARQEMSLAESRARVVELVTMVHSDLERFVAELKKARLRDWSAPGLRRALRPFARACVQSANRIEMAWAGVGREERERLQTMLRDRGEKLLANLLGTGGKEPTDSLEKRLERRIGDVPGLIPPLLRGYAQVAMAGPDLPKGRPEDDAGLRFLSRLAGIWKAMTNTKPVLVWATDKTDSPFVAFLNDVLDAFSIRSHFPVTRDRMAVRSRHLAELESGKIEVPRARFSASDWTEAWRGLLTQFPPASDSDLRARAELVDALRLSAGLLASLSRSAREQVKERLSGKGLRVSDPDGLAKLLGDIARELEAPPSLADALQAARDLLRQALPALGSPEEAALNLAFASSWWPVGPPLPRDLIEVLAILAPLARGL